MTDTSIQTYEPNNGALSAEHYQTFELAKENDDVLGGDNIAQIRSYAAYARAQAQAIHKTIAATSGLDDVAAIKAEATETAQTFAKVGIYADQRIGEILRELPKAKNQHDDRLVGTPTKREAEREANIDHHTAIDLQAMAANPEVVQAVLDRAEAEGRIPSRKQVLDAIHERDMARKVADRLKEERDAAREDAEGYGDDIRSLQEEIAALEAQSDKAYEDGYKAAQRQQGQAPKIVERRVEVPSASDQRRIKELEHLEQLHNSDNAKLRRRLEDMRQELDRAKDILGLDASMREVQSDVQYLIAATNQYVRRYGGLTWTVERLADVDDVTREELRKAVKNLATFSSALMASLESFNG